VGRSAEDRPLLWLSSAADVEEVGRGSSTLAQGVGLKAVGVRILLDAADRLGVN